MCNFPVLKSWVRQLSYTGKSTNPPMLYRKVVLSKFPIQESSLTQFSYVLDKLYPAFLYRKVVLPNLTTYESWVRQLLYKGKLKKIFSYIESLGKAQLSKATFLYNKFEKTTLLYRKVE